MKTCDGNIYTISGRSGRCNKRSTNRHLYNSGDIKSFCEFHRPVDRHYNSREISYEEAITFEILNR